MKNYLLGKEYLSQRILAGFFLGIVAGIFFHDFSLAAKPLGDIFMNLIKMLVVPIIFFGISSGMASVGNPERLKSIGGKVFFVYVLLTAFACVIGVVVTYALTPGAGVVMAGSEKFSGTLHEPSYLKFFVSIVPGNVMEAMVKGNFLQLIFFVIILGLSMVSLDGTVGELAKVLEQGLKVTSNMLNIVMYYAPIGVFSLMAYTAAAYGKELFGALAMFILTDALGCFIVLLSMALFTKFYTGLPLLWMIRKMVPIFINTIATNSSVATIPITLKVVTENFKVPSVLASFSITLGPTICKTGAALYKVLLVIFVAQLYGIDFPVGQLFMLVFISTLMSIATPGIPAGGIATGAVILSAFGMPLDIMGAIAGIYRIIDMSHTSVNVGGHVFGTLLVAKNDTPWTAKEALAR